MLAGVLKGIPLILIQSPESSKKLLFTSINLMDMLFKTMLDKFSEIFADLWYVWLRTVSIFNLLLNFCNFYKIL